MNTRIPLFGAERVSHSNSNRPVKFKLALLFAINLVFIIPLIAQVGISSTAITPHSSSILELRSTTLGFLPPRMTTTERNAIASPAAGIVIYNTTVGKLNYFDGASWFDLSTIPSWAPTTKTATAVLTNTENFIIADCTSGDQTLTLPSSPIDGQEIIIVRSGTNENAGVTIVPNAGQVIGNALTYWTLTERNHSVSFIYVTATSSWRIASRSSFSVLGYRKRGTTGARYYTSANTGTALGTAVLAANTLYAMPLILENSVTIDQLLINVTTAGAGSSVRLGIYDDKNNTPDQKVIDCGAISSATTGVKTFTTGLPLSLPPGLYWLVAVSNATAPTIRGFAVGGLIPVLGLDATLGTAQGFGYSVAFTFAALPTTFPSSPTVRTAAPLPAIFVRYSD